MSVGLGMAIASIWAASAFVAYHFRNDMSPLGAVVCLAIAVWGTAYVMGIKP